jgi:hypothetical protein
MQHVAVHVAKAHARRAGLRMTTRVREQKSQAAMSPDLGDVAALRTRTVTKGRMENSSQSFKVHSVCVLHQERARFWTPPRTVVWV